VAVQVFNLGWQRLGCVDVGRVVGYAVPVEGFYQGCRRCGIPVHNRQGYQDNVRLLLIFAASRHRAVPYLHQEQAAVNRGGIIDAGCVLTKVGVTCIVVVPARGVGSPVGSGAKVKGNRS